MNLSILLFSLLDQKCKVRILWLKNKLWYPAWDLLQKVAAMIIALSLSELLAIKKRSGLSYLDFMKVTDRIIIYHLLGLGVQQWKFVSRIWTHSSVTTTIWHSRWDSMEYANYMVTINEISRKRSQSIHLKSEKQCECKWRRLEKGLF